MSTATKWLISLIILANALRAQDVSAVYKINDLLNRLESKDTLYVVNFWATWCKPCVQELPAFDSLGTAYSGKNVKVILVCLDFKEDLGSKVRPFLKKKNISSQCVLLDELNGNDYIDKVSTEWSGAIPSTLFKYGKRKDFAEKKLRLKDLEERVKALQST
ncbi:MAG TPA: TlpA disulfide reductase family protein [Bacteroidia bacterium]|nr:TlpA disulfide reductase family protein [Bacteroidia bacterium]